MLRPLLRAALTLAILTSTGAVTLTEAPASAAAISPHVQTCFISLGRADQTCTPGAFNPDVTQSTIHSTICVSGWTATVRPPSSYTTALKNTQKTTYGETNVPNSDLEEDHLVPLELGGAPRDPTNLWPEPRNDINANGAESKDTQENSLKKQVCAGTITLSAARTQMISTWTHIPDRS